MREDFEQSLSRVLVHEGGYSNDPADPGGRTNFGITQKVYDGYRVARNLEKQTVKNITRAEVSDIYRKLYANKIYFDELPRGVDYVVFDGAVNSGPAQSVKWIQRAVGMNNADGNMGPATLAMIENHPDHDALIAKALGLRLGMLQGLQTYKRFGGGWRKRIADVLRGGQAWASGSVEPPQAQAAEHSQQRAFAEDVETAPGEDAAPVITTAGFTGTGLIETARQQIEPLAWSGGEWIQRILLALVIAGIAITVGGLIWNYLVKRRQARTKRAMNGQVEKNVYDLEEVQSA